MRKLKALFSFRVIGQILPRPDGGEDSLDFLMMPGLSVVKEVVESTEVRRDLFHT